MTTRLRPGLAASPYQHGADVQETFDYPLLASLSRVPSIAGVSITDRPSGTLVYVALRDMADEEVTYERFAEVRAYFGSMPIKLVSIPEGEWSRLELSPTARRYTF